MSGRSWFKDAQRTSQGNVLCDFSFLTNDVNDPAAADFRGCGGETGVNAAGTSTSNSGPSCVESIAYSAVGVYLVTLADGYRFVQTAQVSIDDGADTLMPRISDISSEGGGTTTKVTFKIKIRAMATGTLTESTGRRVSCSLVLKDSGAGA